MARGEGGITLHHYDVIKTITIGVGNVNIYLFIFKVGEELGGEVEDKPPLLPVFPYPYRHTHTHTEKDSDFK